ncbi:hypothetical protein Csa_002744 [Cucumis sativus]|uniref:Iron-sulfur binding oxidoreductase n=1 Tax=Cucumis sativus TaxID=3659 RepID=A0A0A0KKM6_CUCSA|nr:hypothetical protein Csa_021384 [Cucumis sativus]KGN48306.1 hypothetical protein Csa_002744 [Cucumis sativus]
MSSDFGEHVGEHAGRKYQFRSGGAFRSIDNCAKDRVVVEIATWSLTVVSEKLQVELKLRAVVAAAIALFTKGKLYRFKIQVDAKTNCGSSVQTYDVEVWIPLVGKWEVRSHRLCS